MWKNKQTDTTCNWSFLHFKMVVCKQLLIIKISPTSNSWKMFPWSVYFCFFLSQQWCRNVGNKKNDGQLFLLAMLGTLKSDVGQTMRKRWVINSCEGRSKRVFGHKTLQEGGACKVSGSLGQKKIPFQHFLRTEKYSAENHFFRNAKNLIPSGLIWVFFDSFGWGSDQWTNGFSENPKHGDTQRSLRKNRVQGFSTGFFFMFSRTRTRWWMVGHKKKQLCPGANHIKIHILIKPCRPLCVHRTSGRIGKPTSTSTKRRNCMSTVCWPATGRTSLGLAVKV